MRQCYELECEATGTTVLCQEDNDAGIYITFRFYAEMREHRYNDSRNFDFPVSQNKILGRRRCDATSTLHKQRGMTCWWANYPWKLVA